MWPIPVAMLSKHSLDCWGHGFEFLWQHGYSCIVFVVSSLVIFLSWSLIWHFSFVCSSFLSFLFILSFHSIIFSVCTSTFFILHCRLSLLFSLKILAIFIFLFLLYLFNFLFLYTLPFIIFLASGYHLIYLFVPMLLYFIEHQNFYKFPVSPHLYSLTPISTHVPHDAVCPKPTKCTSFSGKGNWFFRFHKAYRPVVGAASPSVQWAIWSVSAGIKRPDREANQPLPSNAELNNECSHNFTPYMAFKARTNRQIRPFTFTPCLFRSIIFLDTTYRLFPNKKKKQIPHFKRGVGKNIQGFPCMSIIQTSYLTYNWCLCVFFIVHQTRCTFKRSLHSTNNSSHDNDVLVMTQSRNFICFLLSSPQPILCMLPHQAKHTHTHTHTHTHATCSYASNEPECSLVSNSCY